MTRATGWNGRGWKGNDRIGNKRKILRYAQNDNSNAVSAKELHNFPYLCRIPNPKPKPKPQTPKRPKNHPPKKRKNQNTKTYMKRILTFVLAVAIAAAASAQTKKVSILGDSYSTFTGHNPEGYAPFYPNDRNDVTEVEQTWWSLYIKAMGYQLEENNSWGGTTICNTGYGRMDSSKSSFTSRVDMLGNPDIIFIFGGTNDAWAGSPVGEYMWEGWTKEDCKNFRPAYACLIDMLQKKYPNAKIYSLLNSELREEINESSREVCKHYGVQLIELYDIEKQNGHPSIKGMQSICDQLIEAIK